MGTLTSSFVSRAVPRPARGFTLIELMITVAIVAILASVALPAYNDSIQKGRRAQARAALLEAMQAQERWFTQRNTYLEISTAGTSTQIKMFAGDNATSPSYRLKALPCAGELIGACVELTAIPVKADPEAGSLTLRSTGAKSCFGGTKSSVPGFCWP